MRGTAGTTSGRLTTSLLPSGRTPGLSGRPTTTVIWRGTRSKRSLAALDTARPSRPAISAAHRPARQVNNPRSGATRGSCSVNKPAPQALPGHSRRCFRHPNRTRRPNTGRPAGSTSLSPFGSHPPPQPGHNGDTGGGRTPGRGAAGGPHRDGLVHIPQSGHHLTHALMLTLHPGSSFTREAFTAPDYGRPHPPPPGSPPPPPPPGR